MIRACIFDLDGTIIHTLESIRYSMSKAVEKYGYPEATTEQARLFIGDGSRTLMQRYLIANGDDNETHIDESYEAYKAVFRENCTRGNRAYEGMPETLKKLKEMGIRLGVLSNKPDQRTRDCVYDIYGRELFDEVYGERDGIPLKPDPAGILSVMELLNVKGDEVLYFGDSDMDIEAGKAAGCHTVAVCWGYREEDLLKNHNPEIMIHNPSEIVQLLEQF